MRVAVCPQRNMRVIQDELVEVAGKCTVHGLEARLLIRVVYASVARTVMTDHNCLALVQAELHSQPIQVAAMLLQSSLRSKLVEDMASLRFCDRMVIVHEIFHAQHVNWIAAVEICPQANTQEHSIVDHDLVLITEMYVGIV